MILSALNGLYERTVGTEGGPPPLGYAEIPVVGALDISEAGELLQVQDLRREEKVGKKARLVPRRCPVPQPPLGALPVLGPRYWAKRRADCIDPPSR